MCVCVCISVLHACLLYPYSGQSETESGRNFCQQYRGVACAKFLGNRNILVNSRRQQSDIEEKITSKLIKFVCIQKLLTVL